MIGRVLILDLKLPAIMLHAKWMGFVGSLLAKHR